MSCFFYALATSGDTHILNLKQGSRYFITFQQTGVLNVQKKAILADGFCVMIWLQPLVIKLEVKSKSAQFMHEYVE